MVDIPTVPISDIDDEDRFSIMRLDSLAKHHALMCRELQDVAEGRTPNLMLLCPPGSAKSTYTDVVFVPWFMARRPRQNVILASYATGIARKQGRRARQLVKSRPFVNLLGSTLSTETSAAEEWALSNGSEYMAGGLLSGLTGNRAALGIVDDPVAGREEAESETISNKTWDAYIDDFCSRLIPGAPQVMILTRWSDRDLAGRILPDGWNGESGMFDGRDGRRWKVLCLPAIADRPDDPLGRKIGETLWPEWFNEAHWAPFKTNARTWASLYQQKPSPDEGTYFRREWFDGGTIAATPATPARTYARARYAPGQLPKHLRLYGTSDYAVTEDGGDWTVHRLWGVDPGGDIWLLPGGYRAQATSDAWIESLIDLIRDHKPFAWFGEAGVIQKAIEPALLRRMKERETRCRMEWVPSISDKPTRARGFQARAAMGTVHFPEGPEGDAILEEYVRFPAGKHDDDVDNGSLIGRVLDMAHPAIVPPEAKPPGELRGIGQQTWDELMAQQGPRVDRV